MLEPYASNWSERHVAYVCGLGTFGLSKGLITERGMAGRFGSIVTDAELAPTPRKYSDPFEYCTKCGACQFRCPAKAIDKSRGPALAKDPEALRRVGDLDQAPAARSARARALRLRQMPGARPLLAPHT